VFLIQIFLPLSEPESGPFPRDDYQAVEQTLVSQFGGFTAYPRAPAKGLWKNPGEEVEHDELIVYEVIAQSLDRNWWSDYRQSLEQQFRQDKVLIHSHEIEIL
jgi:hypothetical protein